MTQEKLYKIIKRRIKKMSTDKDFSLEDCADSILFNINKHVAEVIGEDLPQNPDYSIMNPFRRMEEDVREHINIEKRKQRKRAGL